MSFLSWFQKNFLALKRHPLLIASRKTHNPALKSTCPSRDIIMPSAQSQGLTVYIALLHEFLSLATLNLDQTIPLVYTHHWLWATMFNPVWNYSLKTSIRKWQHCLRASNFKQGWFHHRRQGFGWFHHRRQGFGWFHHQRQGFGWFHHRRQGFRWSATIMKHRGRKVMCKCAEGSGKGGREGGKGNNMQGSIFWLNFLHCEGKTIDHWDCPIQVEITKCLWRLNSPAAQILVWLFVLF